MERLPKKYFGSISDYVKTYYTAWGVTNFADKAYNAVKTVTKGFTRTDPVFVRVGEDGEPEIHYTMTKADGSSYFANMDLGNATLYVHNGVVLTGPLTYLCRSVKANRISIDNLDNVTSFRSIFSGCSAVTRITLPDVPNAKDCGYAFAMCTSLETMPNVTLPSITVAECLFQGWRFETAPLLDTSKVTNAYAMFYGASKLKEVPAYDLSSSTNNVWIVFRCLSLTAFHAYGMKVSFDLSGTALKHDAILEVFNNLGTVDKTAGITLTLGSEKLALMSDAEKAIATEKGWTLA